MGIGLRANSRIEASILCFSSDFQVAQSATAGTEASPRLLYLLPSDPYHDLSLLSIT